MIPDLLRRQQTMGFVLKTERQDGIGMNLDHDLIGARYLPLPRQLEFLLKRPQT